jgi:peptidoglycan/LPS O-acetylase OafA/YrhL
MTSVQDPTRPPRLVPANAVYYPALDGVRAMALILVFLAHYALIGIFGVGVNVFFVLSGFLITGILLDTKEQPHRARNFYVRRMLRIFPLYYGLFLLALLLTPVFHWQWNNVWIFWITHLGNFILYLPEWLPRAQWMTVANGQLMGAHGVTLNLGHFWSLCVEEQFYLLWPFIVFRASRRALLWLCGCVVVVLPLLRVLAGYTFPPAAIRANVLFRTLPFQIDSLLLGALLVLLLRGEHRSSMVRIGGYAGNAFMIAALVFTYCCIDLHLSALHQPFVHQFKALTWELSVVNLFSAVVILAVLQPGGLLYSVFNNAALRWLGRISYGAYVWHNIAHAPIERLAVRISLRHEVAVTAVLAAGITLIVSVLSYQFFERPFLRLKDRFTLRP